jgi:hypothetical protein
MRQTSVFAFSLNLAATTQPAEPAPTTTTSKTWSNLGTSDFMLQDQERSLEKIAVPDAENIPPIPWANEIFTPGT